MEKKISQLRIYLEHLPTTLPTSHASDSYSRLLNFTLDETWLEAIGEEGAVNRELELALGGRDDNNTFLIQERGHRIKALANILEKYLAIYPNSVLLTKWLDAAHTSAKQCINATVGPNMPVMSMISTHIVSGPRENKPIRCHTRCTARIRRIGS